MFSYYGAGAGKNVSYFIDANVLDQLKSELQYDVSLVEQYSNGNRRQVWLGETSSTYNGGTAGISNSYAAGFMYEPHFSHL
jgi:heparanase 1